MCAFASYYTNLGSAEVDKINRDEHFHRAESLLNQASLIRRNGAPGEKEEQLPVLGMAHLKMARGDTAEAEKLLDAARNLKDDGAENIAPMLWKALFLFRRDQFGDALQWYRRALRAHPGAPASVRLGIGACQLRLGQFAQALKAFERALSLEPQNPDALLGAALAELHGASPSSAGDLEAGDGASSGAYDAGIERGLQYLERAFNVDPHNPATRVALAKHFLVADAPSGDAVRLLTETVAAPGAGGGAGTTDRLRAEAAYTRARSAHRSGDLAGARSLYQAAAQLDETFAAPAFGLAQVALARGDRKAAGVYADQARAAFPESHPVVRVYGHLRRAEDAARSAAAGGGMVSVGKAGAGAGRDAETAAALRRAADADASDFAARLELGDALLGAGEYAEASAAYERAAEIAPGGAPSAALLNNCGVLRAMTGRGAHEGRFEKARGWFLRALAAAHAESDDSGEKKTGEALDVSAVRVKTPEAALPVAFNLARLVEDRGMVADAERRYRDLLVASPKMTECLLRLASMRAERRDFDAATALAREALAADAADTDAMAFLGHLLMKQGRWADAQAQFKLLRAAHKPLGAQAAQLAAAAGKDPKAATHATDEYAMISVANAAYYQAMRAQSAGNRNRAASDEKSSKAVKEHLEYAATMYTKALQKSESNLFAANGLGILLAEKGKIEEAKETFQMVAEGLRAAPAGGEGDADANGAAEDRASKFPDIWINQGHIQHAKGNWDAAARHYAQAQAKFFHNLDPSVMLYQARNAYESGTAGLPESQKTLRRALHVAPWNHRLRFNLAYVIQEKAQREMQTLLRAGQKIAGGGVAEDGGTKAARVQTAIDEMTLAGSIFDQLLTVANAAQIAGGDDGDKEERKRRASAKLGFDKSKVRTHADFCRGQMKDFPAHLAKARAEDAAFHAKRESLMAERRAEMEKLAMEKAKARADEELRRRAEEAAAAAARDKFKRSNEEYMARTAGEREAEAAAEGRSGKGAGGGAEYVDEDDDDVPAPDAELAKPKTAEEKAALKATGLFSDSEEEEEEEEAQDTDTEEEEAPGAAQDAEPAAEPEGQDDSPAEEDPAPSGRRARAKPEAAAEKNDKAKKAMEALAAKSRKKRGLEPKTSTPPPQEKETEPEAEAPSRKRRKALVDDDDE